MTPGVSAGSNHVGASETWTANVICPSAAPAGGGADQRARAAQRTRMARAPSGRDRPRFTAGSIHPGPRAQQRPARVSPRGQSMTAIASTSTTRSGCASLRTSTVVLVGSAPKYSMRTSTCLKNSSMSVT